MYVFIYIFTYFRYSIYTGSGSSKRKIRGGKKPLRERFIIYTYRPISYYIVYIQYIMDTI